MLYIYILFLLLFFMKKVKIKGISHTDNVVWFRVEPCKESIYILNKLVMSIDKEFHEGILKSDQEINYEDFVPNRYSHDDGDGKIYAISIFFEDLIDFIILKDHPFYEEVMKIMTENFIFSE